MLNLLNYDLDDLDVEDDYVVYDYELSFNISVFVKLFWVVEEWKV